MHCAYSTPRISLVVSKRSYVHVPRVLATVSGEEPRCAEGRAAAWSAWAGYYRVGIPGGYYPPHHPVPTLPATLVLPGPNRWPRQRFCVHPGTPGALAGPFRTPGLLALKYRPQDQYGRDSTSNILKLVINPECRPFSLMRPAILPVSKNPVKCHDLEFPENGLGPAFSHKE